MRRELGGIRLDDLERGALTADPALRGVATTRRLVTGLTQLQGALAARHREIHIGQDPRIEQRAVQLALGVVDAVTLAERIEIISLARMQLARKREGIEHPTRAVDGGLRPGQSRELGVQKTDVESRVMNDQLSPIDERQKLGGDRRKDGLASQLLERHAVYRGRALVDLALGIEVAMKVTPCRSSRHELDAADFDDAMAVRDLEAGGFSVEDDLSHGRGF